MYETIVQMTREEAIVRAYGHTVYIEHYLGNQKPWAEWQDAEVCIHRNPACVLIRVISSTYYD